MGTIYRNDIPYGASLRENSADRYDPSHSYAVGDLCIHQSILYKCIATTTGDWNESAWEMTTIADELDEISETIENQGQTKLDYIDLGTASTNEEAFNLFKSNFSNLKIHNWYSAKLLVGGNYSLMFGYRYSDNGYIGYLLRASTMYYNNYYSNANHIETM